MNPVHISLLVPTVYLAGALLPSRFWPSQPVGQWAVVRQLSWLAMLVAVGQALLSWWRPDASPMTLSESIPLSVRADAMSAVLHLLIAGLAAIILPFAGRYLNGEPGQRGFQRWFLSALAAVSLLVTTDDLAVLALAWTVANFALHKLLAHYTDRPEAVVAAHKQWLVNVAADLLLVVAVGLIWNAVGTQRISDMTALIGSPVMSDSLSLTLQAAAVLVVLAVCLRTAQLPAQGWLIQVMEAPTPVSAFLHAGLVNIGGVVLLRLAALLSASWPAQTLLVIIGGTTAVLAALVMQTRVSIKVSLAWSTSAQMGFMLVELGLGAYRLALLHLVAHSLYKAHAFLTSGRTVEQWIRAHTVPLPTSRAVIDWVRAFGIAATGVTLLFVSSTRWNVASPDDLVSGSMLALALMPLLTVRLRDGMTTLLAHARLAAGLLFIALAAHALAQLMPVPALVAVPDALRLGLAATLALALVITQVLITVQPHGAFAKALYPACFAGFYVDDVFTRLTFRWWPPRTPARSTPRASAFPAVLHSSPA
jgi:NAD(P)H-quinone oxidoreductase subunit 5